MTQPTLAARLAEPMPALLIGQNSDCDIRVSDPYVSGQHARITIEPDGTTWIEDLGSTNGTYLEHAGVRRRIQGPALLQIGDVIWLGLRTQLPWWPSTPSTTPPAPPAQRDGETGRHAT